MPEIEPTGFGLFAEVDEIVFKGAQCVIALFAVCFHNLTIVIELCDLNSFHHENSF